MIPDRSTRKKIMGIQSLQEKKKKQIMHRRWIITGIITVILTTLLHLWFIVIGALGILLGLYLAIKFLYWIFGGDLGN